MGLGWRIKFIWLQKRSEGGVELGGRAKRWGTVGRRYKERRKKEKGSLLPRPLPDFNMLHVTLEAGSGLGTRLRERINLNREIQDKQNQWEIHAFFFMPTHSLFSIQCISLPSLC